LKLIDIPKPTRDCTGKRKPVKDKFSAHESDDSRNDIAGGRCPLTPGARNPSAGAALRACAQT